MIRTPKSPATVEPSTAFAPCCPRCGGVLEHESDRQGYGQTIEQCEHVVTCGYWRTLEGPRIPAHAPAPPDHPAPRSNAGGKRHYTRGTERGALQAALIAAVPIGEANACSAADLARRLPDFPRNSVAVRARQLSLAGWFTSAERPQPGTPPIRVYWRNSVEATRG